MLYFLIFFIAAVGSFIQAVTGFGAAIFMMLFYPSLLSSFSTATALNGGICLASNVSNVTIHRKKIAWKRLPLPVIAYFVISFAAIRLTAYLNTDLLKLIFGAVLVLLSVYFLFIAKKLRIRPTVGASLICGTVSGLTGGLFAASGPPMVVYFLAVSDSKEEYIGTLQAFCLITGLWSLGVRIFSGFYTLDMIPLILLGILGVAVGQFVGTRVMNKLSADLLRKVVYVMLAVIGVIDIVEYII